jgi:uncharacterized protein (TIGR02996 family)
MSRPPAVCPSEEGSPVEQAFLRHIVEEPEDLVARRAYADWLSEQPGVEAQERGEFIALQCELAGKVRHGGRRRLEQRQAEPTCRVTWPRWLTAPTSGA